VEGSSYSLEGLREITKILVKVSIAGIPAKIGTQHLVNTNKFGEVPLIIIISNIIIIITIAFVVDILAVMRRDTYRK
jgi:hypothetical protein